MKQKVVVKIFLPNTRSSASTNQTEYLYGEVKCEYECESACRQIFIFIASRRPKQENCNSAKQQILGEISSNQWKYDNIECAEDYVWLEYDSDASDLIRLKKLCLPVSVPGPEYKFKVQIILYEPKTFLKLSKDDREMQSNTAVLDPIVYLIKLLRHREISNKPSSKWCHRLQQFFWLILMTVNRILSYEFLRKDKSAFLRHLSIWLNSIKLFTFKRYSIVKCVP